MFPFIQCQCFDKRRGVYLVERNQRFIKIRVLFWPEISALGVFLNFDNERMRPPPPGHRVSNSDRPVHRRELCCCGRAGAQPEAFRSASDALALCMYDLGVWYDLSSLTWLNGCCSLKTLLISYKTRSLIHPVVIVKRG